MKLECNLSIDKKDDDLLLFLTHIQHHKYKKVAKVLFDKTMALIVAYYLFEIIIMML